MPLLRSILMKPKMISLAILLSLIFIGKSLAFSQPKMIGEGEYPTIAQGENGIYWLVFDKQDGLYITHSSNLINWSKPEKLPFSKENDYDAYLRIYDGKFYIAFTRHKIVNPHSLLGFDYDVYLAIGDKREWRLYAINNSNKSIDWYPYIYRDPNNRFWLVYSKNFKDGSGSSIVVRYSNDGVHWSREYKAIPPDAIFGTMFYFKDRYYMIYAKYTGNYSIPEIMNLHDLYIAYSFDGINWIKAGKLTETPPPFNFTLYVDAETDGKSIWVSFTSTIEGNEEIYIMGSQDGVRWSTPVRLSRNIEYIQSLDKPFNFKCDQKDLLIDKDGNVIVVYQSAIYKNETIWIVYGKPEMKEIVKEVRYNIDLPYRYNLTERENKRAPFGIEPILVGFASTFIMYRRIKKGD